MGAVPWPPDGLHVAPQQCVYCGQFTGSRSPACRDHRDLLALDPNAERWRKRPRLGTGEGR